MMVTGVYPLPMLGGYIPAKYPLRLHNRNDQDVVFGQKLQLRSENYLIIPIHED